MYLPHSSEELSLGPRSFDGRCQCYSMLLLLSTSIPVTPSAFACYQLCRMSSISKASSTSRPPLLCHHTSEAHLAVDWGNHVDALLKHCCRLYIVMHEEFQHGVHVLPKKVVNVFFIKLHAADASPCLGRIGETGKDSNNLHFRLVNTRSRGAEQCPVAPVCMARPRHITSNVSQ